MREWGLSKCRVSALRCPELAQQGADVVFRFLEVDFSGSTEGSLCNKCLVCITEFCPGFLEQFCRMFRLRVSSGKVMSSRGESCIGFMCSYFRRSCEPLHCCVGFVSSCFCSSNVSLGGEKL
jgi:hypothetical protein